MLPGPTYDRVMELRTAREKRGLSISEIMIMLKENGAVTGAAIPSESSVRNVLTGDLEKISGFSYESTLHPLERILLPKSANETAMAVMLDIMRAQEEAIKNLTERLQALEDAQRSRCKKCEADTAKLWGQIAIKDKRMERKDRWIAQLLKLPIQEEKEQ